MRVLANSGKLRHLSHRLSVCLSGAGFKIYLRHDAVILLYPDLRGSFTAGTRHTNLAYAHRENNFWSQKCVMERNVK
jgi:hypothetical protein